MRVKHALSHAAGLKQRKAEQYGIAKAGLDRADDIGIGGDGTHNLDQLIGHDDGEDDSGNRYDDVFLKVFYHAVHAGVPERKLSRGEMIFSVLWERSGARGQSHRKT